MQSKKKEGCEQTNGDWKRHRKIKTEAAKEAKTQTTKGKLHNTNSVWKLKGMLLFSPQVYGLSLSPDRAWWMSLITFKESNTIHIFSHNFYGSWSSLPQKKPSFNLFWALLFFESPFV